MNVIHAGAGRWLADIHDYPASAIARMREERDPRFIHACMREMIKRWKYREIYKVIDLKGPIRTYVCLAHKPAFKFKAHEPGCPRCKT